MTKAERRAYAKQQEELLREEMRRDRLNKDLEEIGRLRRHLVYHCKRHEGMPKLLTAIDDFVESITGNRETLWSGDFRQVMAGPAKKD